MSGGRIPDENLCIICHQNRGTIQISDGLVCGKCMPKELLPKAPGLSRENIRIFHRLHQGEDWENCEGGGEQPISAPAPDRSMIITANDGILLCDELTRQFRTADRADIVVSFILKSGLNDIIDGIRDLTSRGKLRVITTAYMGNTEYEALDELFGLPNTEVRMELHSGDDRLHAKAFIFYRRDGSGTVFVGSANISHSALTYGEEWVSKIREQDAPEVMKDAGDAYDRMWNSGNYVPVDRGSRASVEAALQRNGRN